MTAAALISLVQRWAGVEIVSQVVRDALSVYRQMMDTLKSVIFDTWLPLPFPLPWPTFSMPYWGMDVLAVWLLASTSFWSFSEARRAIQSPGAVATQPISLGMFWGTAIASAFLVAMLLWPATLVAGFVTVAYFQARSLRSRRREALPVETLRPLSPDAKARMNERRSRRRELWLQAQARWRRHGYKAWFATLVAWFVTAAFFVFNAIQLSPA